jgi:hypothetical protein
VLAVDYVTSECGEAPDVDARGSAVAVLNGSITFEAGGAGGGVAADLRDGGLYTLCYCGHSCLGTGGSTSHGMFLLDFGLLLVAGLFKNHMETCSAGTECPLMTLEGYSLTTDDRVALVKNSKLCGVDERDNTLWRMYAERDVPAEPATGGPNGYSQALRVTLPWTDLRQGGVFRICHCPSYGGCDDPQDFSVDAGTLTVKGPFGHPGTGLAADYWVNGEAIARTCVSGQTCRFDIPGQSLAAVDSIMILETCASRTDGAIAVAAPAWPETVAPTQTAGSLARMEVNASGAVDDCTASCARSCAPSCSASCADACSHGGTAVSFSFAGGTNSGIVAALGGRFRCAGATALSVEAARPRSISSWTLESLR